MVRYPNYGIFMYLRKGASWVWSLPWEGLAVWVRKWRNLCGRFCVPGGVWLYALFILGDRPLHQLIIYWAYRYLIQQWEKAGLWGAGVLSVHNWTDLQGVLGRSVVVVCLETQLLGRRSREAELFLKCRKIKAPVMMFPEMRLLSPAGKYKVRQTRVSLCSW